jgi:hypothetical protein
LRMSPPSGPATALSIAAARGCVVRSVSIPQISAGQHPGHPDLPAGGRPFREEPS